MTALATNLGGAITVDGAPLALRKKLKDEAAEWIAAKLNASGRPIYFVTLTCDQGFLGNAGGLVYLTRELLSEAVRVYFRRIDKAVLKSAARRHGKGIDRACYIEGGKWPDKRWHEHALVVAPPSGYMDTQRFVELHKATWRSSPWGRVDVYCEPVKILDCSSKYLVKMGVDAIDWSNCRFSGL